MKSVASEAVQAGKPVWLNTNVGSSKQQQKSSSSLHRYPDRVPTGPVYYDSRNVLGILIQIHGSIWPKVLPYIAVNTSLMIVLQYVVSHYPFVKTALQQNNTTHTFAGLIVSFLLIARINNALSGYLECRQYISILFQKTREMIVKAITYSRNMEHHHLYENYCYDTDTGTFQEAPAAASSAKIGGNTTAATSINRPRCDNIDDDDVVVKLWRNELIYRCLLLLRTIVTNIEYPARQFPAYELNELKGTLSTYENNFVQPPSEQFMLSNRVPQSVAIDSVRVPLKVEELVRETIKKQKYLYNKVGVGEKEEGNEQVGDEVVRHRRRRSSPILTPQEEMNLHSVVDAFMVSYFGIRKFFTTPVPFPLVQMGHTMGLLYVFSFPLLYLDDSDSDTLWSLLKSCFDIFMLTYGFYGVMLTSTVLDDPFGKQYDANCFDVAAYSLFAIDDALVMISDVDGPRYVQLLRQKLNLNTNTNTYANANANIVTSETASTTSSTIGTATTHDDYDDDVNHNNYNHTKKTKVNINGYFHINSNSNNINVNKAYGSTWTNEFAMESNNSRSV